MTTKAAEKRYAAISAVVDKYLIRNPNGSVQEGDYYLPMDTSKTLEIIRDVTDLRLLGRTDRWQGRLDQWIELLTDYSDTEKGLFWAMCQGAIFAGWGAE